MKPISSWGRLSAEPHEILTLSDPAKVYSQICNQQSLGLAHGMGRSYGDVCLNPGGLLWCTSGLDRFISFDASTGRLVCEAGLLLRDIQNLFISRGWILPVTPGTQMVTVGGAIANDVHGKNHHRVGSFGNHIQNIKLLRTDGEIIECSPQIRKDWFAATIGGLGLTGVILEAEIQLRRVAGPWLNSETLPYASLDEFFYLAQDSEKNWEHTVSWIDCLSGGGRGLFMRANPIDAKQSRQAKDTPHKMFFVPPLSLVNRFSLRPFNCAYYHLKKRRAAHHLIHYKGFFYPLDNLLEWNRIYGPKGFFQYQSVVPRETGQDATLAMLKEIARSGEGSFLAVLKTFGNCPSLGMLSFPLPGVTLALDFANRGEGTHKLFTRLDAIVREAGGRIYMAKDARMPLLQGYPRLNEFLKYRDPGISSGLSRRLLGA